MNEIINEAFSEERMERMHSAIKDTTFSRDDIISFQRDVDKLINGLRSDNPEERELWVSAIEALFEMRITVCVNELHDRGL